jgi:hypothetical protein
MKMESSQRALCLCHDTKEIVKGRYKAVYRKGAFDVWSSDGGKLCQRAHVSVVKDIVL